MMIRLYPEQLRAQLTEGLRAAYLLLGNDPLLLQESQDAIREAAAAQGFTEHHTFSIDNSTDWQAIFALSQAMSLFASRQTLLLILPENGPNAAINEQLATLVGLLHDDLLLIVRGNKHQSPGECRMAHRPGSARRPGQLPDAGIRAAAALAGRPCQTASAAARRRGQSAAVLLLRRQSAGAGAGAGASGAALAGR